MSETSRVVRPKFQLKSRVKSKLSEKEFWVHSYIIGPSEEIIYRCSNENGDLNLFRDYELSGLKNETTIGFKF